MSESTRARSRASISTNLADDGATSAAYRQIAISNQLDPPHKTTSGQAASLTPAEARVLTLLTTYQTLAEIGDQLGMGRPTVKTHVASIYRNSEPPGEPRQ